MTATESREDAQKIADSLVHARLAGCVQVIGPIVSTYWWEGHVQTAEEWLCLAKTREDRYTEIEEAITQMHPYDLPEILALPVVAGSVQYLTWLAGTLDAPRL
ncbi:MAG TPA: divalent-cation tolerance protein CutA [Chloroflexota bacterium]